MYGVRGSTAGVAVSVSTFGPTSSGTLTTTSSAVCGVPGGSAPFVMVMVSAPSRSCNVAVTTMSATSWGAEAV